ncbi:pilus assembly protein [Acidimangrovimonas sediminis]|uniref:Pilus assembly protein n=1 Tax=Albidovulum sediminis TaxID=3066345 RepID=A0ABT2NLU7_9RHOB|nr:TadE/TadG family type IV pilus assembly protein [Defluviimonas sediminis]MCT8329913.1 pilus assembly protein [Defluviimonas sediminis]
MGVLSSLPRRLRRFLGRDEGAVLVEFAFVLPLLLIFFAVIVEGTRMMKNYHSAISGVRDATRFMSRHLPIDLCAVAPANLDGYNTTLRNIVGQSVSGVTLFPSGISLSTVQATYSCPAGTYHVEPAVVRVTATLTINFPFSSVFELLGGESFSNLTTTISDSAKVFGT